MKTLYLKWTSACVGVLSIIELKNARWNIEIRKSYLFVTLNNLGPLTKLRKVAINFDMSVRPSVHMEHLGSHLTDFH